MTALTNDKKVDRMDGVDVPFPVKALKTIYAGALVATDATGYLLPGADTAGLIFQGLATQYKDNSAGDSGDETVIVRRRGLVKMTLDTAITQANVGDNVFLVDDQTVDVAANTDNDIFCGVIAGYIDSTHAWVDIEPAIRQADVATHIADTSGAHSASAVSLADAGAFTDETEVEAALQEVYQDLQSAAHVIPVNLTAITQEDGTALTAFSAGATPGFQQLSNKDLVLAWDGNASPGAVAVAIPFVDPAIDDSADVVVHMLAKMAGATDTPVVAIEAYFGSGDTDCAGTDPEVTGTSLAEYTMTIDADDVPAAPSALTLVLTPTAGQMDTDELHLHAIWLEVKRKLRTA